MANYSAKSLLPLAQRTGRWTNKQVRGQNCLYTTNLGSSIRLIVNNSCSLTINVLNNGQPGFPSQMYAWRRDGLDWHRFSAATLTCQVTLPDNGPHLVELITAGNTDLDQVWNGQQGFAITGIETTGTLTAAPQRPLVDFIGDSITAGCWVAGKHAAADYRPESNYVGIACDNLEIDSVRIAYSAAGVLRPGTGGVPVAKDFLLQIDADTSWQPNTPQLVVINLGVNDRRFSADEFSTAYDQFVGQVLASFPDIPVVLLVPFSQTYRAEIAAIAERYQLKLVETAGWCTNFTDGLHPNQYGAQTGGAHLTNTLKSLLA